ncbi:MAG: NUDIX hydrolase [Gemmobacter sp.]|nr:NUDIX hydrolase [Gemmobacter sp.]
MIRRFDLPPDSTRRYTRRPGVYAILRLGSDILLTHQDAPVPEFQLPGGGIDPGEHPLAALHREVLEETGWKMTLGQRLGAFRRFTYMPEYDLWAEKVCVVYLARPALRVGPPTEHGHSAVWAPIATAVGVLRNPGDRHFLSSVL